MTTKTGSFNCRNSRERGSLALEQILFIGAIVALSAGLFAFYDNLSNYFRNISFADSPKDLGKSSGG